MQLKGALYGLERRCTSQQQTIEPIGVKMVKRHKTQLRTQPEESKLPFSKFASNNIMKTLPTKPSNDPTSSE